MKPRMSAITAAVGSLLAASTAIAQSSNVQLYGRANLGVDWYEADGSSVAGADRDGRFRVYDNSSRVGLRGTEDLGNGLKAIFQIETGVNVDNGSNTGQGGQGNGSTGFWASRDSYVGLNSNFGRLTFGRQSIYYSNGVNAQFASNYINTEVPWTDGRAFGRVRAPASRTSNVVLYTSPTFVGMNGSLYYSPNAQEAVQNNATSDTDGSIWGATVRGTWGPFYAQLDYVSNEGNSPATGAPRSDQSAWKLGASWGYMPGARIGAIWTRAYDNRALGVVVGNEVYQDSWTINWEHTFGNFQLMAQYGQLGSMKDCGGSPTVSCGDTKANAYMVGARYFLSKRTWLYSSWNYTDNDQNQFADYTNSGYTSVSGALFPYGADPQVWAVGLLHNF